MRQGNSNKRMRGRGGGGGGNVGRKGPNPLSRTYESTGPDVKIRGTALHIAEKYVSLARDAQSSGDPVLAESYLQHAEHYYRIIAAAQAAMPQPMPVIRSDIQNDDDDDDGDDSFAETRFDTRGRGEFNGAPDGQRGEGPREQRGEGRGPYRRAINVEGGEGQGTGDAPRGEGRGPYRRAINVENGEGQGSGEAPRGEGRAPARRAIDLEGGDGYMAPDAPQPFVDDSALDRVIGERGDDRRHERGRNRFPRARGEFRGEGRSGETRAEGARTPRDRHTRGEGRFDREPREGGRTEAGAREEVEENRLDALPAFLTAAPPRVSVAAVAAAQPAETPEADESEGPRRRTRGGRGRGRRADAAGTEGAADAVAPAGAED